MNYRLLGAFSIIFLFSALVSAAPFRTTYQAKIIKPDGQPLQASSVNFRFTILDPTATCILYVEDYSAINMHDSGGLAAFSLGAGVRSFPTSGTSQTFQNIFDNSIASFPCQTAGVYLPVSSDIRKIVMQFNDGTGWQSLQAMTINAVPYSMYASKSDNSIQLNGKSDTAFVEYSTLAALNCQANEAIKFNGASFSCLAVGGSVTSGSVITALGYTPADGASVTALTSSLSSTNSTITSVSSTVFSVSSTVSSLAASFAAMTSSQWNTSGTTINYTIGNAGIGTTTPVTKLDVSGGLRISMESATCAASFAGTLRYNSGNVEYCNGTTWSAFGVSGAGLQSLNGSTSGTQSFAIGSGGIAPSIATNTGVHTFSVPYAASSSVTGGLLSNADYVIFTNKLNSTSAAVTSALGYTPADTTSVGASFTAVTTNVSNLSTSMTTLNSTVSSLSSSVATIVSSQWSTSGTTINYTTGNVGIGTTAPANLFHVEGPNTVAWTNTAKFNAGQAGSDNAGSYISIQPALASGRFDGGRIYGGRWNATASGTRGLKLAATDWSGAQGVNAEYNFVLLDSGNNSFSVNTNNTERLKIDSSGNVGIGTSTPYNWPSAGVLEIHGTSNGNLRLSGGASSSDIYSNSFGDLIFAHNGVSRNYFSSAGRLGLGLFTGAATRLHQDEGNATATYHKFTAGTTTGQTSSDGFDVGIDNTGNARLVQREAAAMVFSTSGTERMRLDYAGNLGVGITVPSAQLHLAAGTSSNASFKFTSGTLLTSPQSGTIEYDGTNFYVTDGTNTRRAIAANTNPGTYDNVSNINSSGNITVTPTGSVTVSSTTASINSQTGALVVKGGVGVAGNIYSSGTIITSSNIQGSVITATSATITPFVYGSTLSGGVLTLDSTTHATKGNILLAPTGGNVGIGTTSPAVLLDLQTGSTNENFRSKRFVGSNSWSNIFRLYQARGTQAAPLASNNGDSLVAFTFGGYDGSGWVDSAGITAYANGTVSAGSIPTDIAFTTGSSGGGSERMRILSNGNIGIGTTTAVAPLQVNHTDPSKTRTVYSYLAPNFTANQSANLHGIWGEIAPNSSFDMTGAYYAGVSRIDTGSSQTGAINAALGFIGDVYHDGSGSIDDARGITGNVSNRSTGVMTNARGGYFSVFNTSSGTIATGYGVYIGTVQGTTNYGVYQTDSSADNYFAGNVGIGTTTPSSKLHVNGTITADGLTDSSAGTALYLTTASTTAGVGSIYMNDSEAKPMFEVAPMGPRTNYSWLRLDAGTDTLIPHIGSFANATNPGLSLGVGTAQTLNIIAGNVGIGTTTPDRILHLKQNSPEMIFEENDQAADARKWRIWSSSGQLSFQPLTDAITGSPSPAMEIARNGNVGIGTTSPVTNLQVGGGGAYMAIPANGYPYIPAAWRRGNAGGVFFANSQNADGTGWSYGTRIINHDYGNGLALSFDALYGGTWTNDVLVVSGRGGVGNVGIGTAAPSEKLHIVGNLRVQGSTDCTLGNGAGGTNCSSDARLKENIKPIPYALEKVISLKGVEFDWNAKSLSHGRHDIGVIAQDVEKVFPTAVMNDKNTGYKKVDYAVLVAPLIEAFKSLYDRIVGVESDLSDQKRQIASINSLKADKADVEVLKQKAAEVDALKAKSDKLEAENAELKARLEKIEKALNSK